MKITEEHVIYWTARKGPKFVKDYNDAKSHSQWPRDVYTSKAVHSLINSQVGHPNANKAVREASNLLVSVRRECRGGNSAKFSLQRRLMISVSLDAKKTASLCRKWLNGIDRSI